MLEANDFPIQNELPGAVMLDVLKANVLDPVSRATRTAKLHPNAKTTPILGPSGADIVKGFDCLEAPDLWDIWQHVPKMLKASASEWYHTTGTSLRHGAQCQVIANSIHTTLAWMPTLSKLRERPLVADLIQRFLGICSNSCGDETYYSATWDDFDYPGEGVCDGLSEEVIETDKSIRDDFFVFRKALDGLDSILTSVLPSVKNEAGVDCWDEAAVAARDALLEVSPGVLSDIRLNIVRPCIFRLPVGLTFSVIRRATLQI